MALKSDNAAVNLFTVDAKYRVIFEQLLYFPEENCNEESGLGNRYFSLKYCL